MEQALRNTIGGYTSVAKKHGHFHTENANATPVLMPVWLITTEKEGKTYTFAINGQTGKLTCDVPADTKKSWLYGGGTFALVFALVCAALYFMESLASGTLVIAAVAALIAAFAVYGVLLSQLKQAESVQSAGNYIVRDSFELFVRRDIYLHTTTTRRRIEQKENSANKG